MEKGGLGEWRAPDIAVPSPPRQLAETHLDGSGTVEEGKWGNGAAAPLPDLPEKYMYTHAANIPARQRFIQT